MWSKLKVETAASFSSLSLNSTLHRAEKDKSEHDTVLSRAILRHYQDDVPHWLEPAHQANAAPMRIPKPSLNSVQQAPAALGRTSLDFLNKGRPSPVPRENPITALSQGLPNTKSKGRLGEKLRKSNW